MTVLKQLMKFILAELIYRTIFYKRQTGLYADGSSYMDKGNRKSRCAIVTLEGVEAKALPPGTSAQKAELIALTRALELLHAKSKCVF